MHTISVAAFNCIFRFWNCVPFTVSRGNEFVFKIATQDAAVDPLLNITTSVAVEAYCVIAVTQIVAYGPVTQYALVRSVANVPEVCAT